MFADYYAEKAKEGRFMAYTLGKMLQNPIFSDAAPLFPYDAELPVESITTQGLLDMPIIEFVPRHAVVLCAVGGFPAEETGYVQLLEQAHAADAAAAFMCFKNGSFRLSDDAVFRLSELHFPVFLIPWNVSFAAIHEQIGQQIMQEKQKIFHDVQEKLFSLFLNSEPLNLALQIVADLFHSPCSLRELSGKIIAQSGSVGEGTSSEETLEIPIELYERNIAVLSVSSLGESGRALAENPVFNRSVCFPLSMWFHRMSVEDLITTSIKNDFVRNLATKNYSSYEEMVFQGHRLHFDLNKPYTCIVLQLSANETEQQNVLYSREASNLVDHALDEVLNYSREKHVAVMYSFHTSQIIFYLENLSTDPSLVDEFIDLLDRTMYEFFPDHTLYWGTSEILLGYTDYSKLYSQALLALSYALHSQKHLYRYTYHDTKQAQITMQLSSNPDIKADAWEIIGRLSDYNKQSGIELLETLNAYLDANYNVSETARKLFIHRQSLLYRLEKIEEVSGMSLKKRQDLFLLEVYMHIYNGY